MADRLTLHIEVETERASYKSYRNDISMTSRTARCGYSDTIRTDRGEDRIRTITTLEQMRPFMSYHLTVCIKCAKNYNTNVEPIYRLDEWGGSIVW